MWRPFSYLIAIIFLALPSHPSIAVEGVDPTPLCVVTTSGAHLFKVEVARTQAEKSMGLMFRKSLAEDHGMVFIYKRPRQVAMWMKNTFIPLDLVFIKSRGEVANVVHDAIPHDETPRPSTGRVGYVLELAAGVAKKINLRAGDQIFHPSISQVRARPDACRN